MAKKVTMSDIAKELSVSTVTVSKALSGQKGVSEELRDEIIKLAASRGYKKSEAREITGKPHNIGVIVAERFLEGEQSFYWNLYQEFNKRAAERGSMTFLEVINNQSEEGGVVPKLLHGRRVEGLVVMGTFVRSYRDKIMTEADVPLVFLDADSESGKFDSIVSDNVLGGSQMTDYLFSLGHKDIAYVGTLHATNSIDERYLGYVKSLMNHGFDSSSAKQIDDRAIHGLMFSADELKLPRKMPTAFFCNCDVAAMILIEKLTKAGLSVPGDVSVVGFDNYVNEGDDPEFLTTYALDPARMAKRAVHIMIRKIENVNYSTGKFVLPGWVIERASAKKAGRAVPFVI